MEVYYSLLRDGGPQDRARAVVSSFRPLLIDFSLVKVRAASVNAFDWHMMTADFFVVRLSEGLRRPKTPIRGADVAGTVEAVGKNVTRFKPGDEVFGQGRGSFAEYTTTSETGVAPKPRND